MLLLLAPIIFQACKDDEEPEASLAGTWTVSDQEIKILAQGQDITTLALALLEEQDIDIDSILVFPDNTRITFASDSTYTTTPLEANQASSGTWSLDAAANSLTIFDNSDVDPVIFSVQTLDKNNLVLSTSEEVALPAGTIPQIPIPVNAEVIFTLSLVR